MKRVILLSIFVLILQTAIIFGRSVTHKREDKDQATIDKEVLFEDDDYDDEDVLDLPAAEQKQRLKSLVEKKIDANHDGFVDLEELQAWSLKAFEAFDTEDTKEEFHLVDGDKDGLVSWVEHIKDAFGDGFSEDSADQKQAKQLKKEKKLFAAADLDTDDQLELGEYLIFKIPRRHSITRRVLVEDALENLDANSDGALDVEEYLLESADDADHESFVASDTERFNDELDANGDGVLTDDEIVQWLDPDNKEDADDEADHLISECDSNKDGKLSPSEIVDNHDLWVESDATDYGKQLLMNHDEF